jgi:carboxyl-terminal processing protease
MQRFKPPRSNLWAIACLISISTLCLVWVVSPIPSLLAKPQAQVFDRVWQTVNDNFFDPKFNGVDWKALGEQYKSQAVAAKSTTEFAAVVNQMLSQLRTSHTRYYTPDEPAYYQILGIFAKRNPDLQKQLKKFLPQGKIEYAGIGIFTKKIQGKTFISGILEASPAAKAKLKVGDRIASVDGNPFQPIQAFTNKIGKPVTLAIQRSANTQTQQEIQVTPQIFDATTMFIKAQQASTQIIQKQAKKIGYVHIWSYAGDEYQRQLEEDLMYGRLQDADGLVLDLRDGWGGASPNYLNIYTANGPSVTMTGRDRQPSTANYQWKKPVVMVVNEGSRSGKEILAFGFQRYKIGSVVGSPTAGAVVGGRPFIMPDGSVLYLAVADVIIDGKYRLEGKPITPDIVVPFTLEYAQGTDPQKERAIDLILRS